MARYVIGDIQGCYDEFMALLSLIQFSPSKDHLYLVGDLVNRGPRSLEVLRWARQYQCSVSVVLGNHDLHLLACFKQLATQKKGDTLTEILNASDAPSLCHWLCQQPLLLNLDDGVVVHAGIHPCWSLDQAISLADEVSAILRSQDYRHYFAAMYGNKPANWDVNLQGLDRLRFATNVFTRMRLVDKTGELDFKFKGEMKDKPKNLYPWFDMPKRSSIAKRIFFGHWSALGLLPRADVYAIDTGCVWGGLLTAYCIESDQVFQVKAAKHPGAF